MKRKVIGVVILTLAMLVSSCGQDGNAAEQTTAAVTEAEKNWQDYADVVAGEKTLEYGEADLGLEIYCVKDTQTCVKAELKDEKCLITPFRPGADTVTVYNVYGETATVEANVGDDLSMDVKVSSFQKPAFSLNTKDEGAADGADITTVLQSCIDRIYANGGGTVYVPAGNYTLGTMSIKNGVAVRFEGFVPDASVGYTTDVQDYVASGKIAVIKTNGKAKSSFFFLNVDLPQSYCTSGYSDFTVCGGMFDCEGKMKLLGMACAENVVFENILVKDNPNNHAMQIEGCKNVVVRNMMFAGYNWPASDGVLTRETIQLEPTTEGAIGSNNATNAILCNDGDFHSCSNVTITHCYFGKSDKYGSHLVAVGHHSATGGLVCDGFEFSYNTVDNPLYCGLHLPDYINVKIFGNTFISDAKATDSAMGADSALISLYTFDKDSSYTSSDGVYIKNLLSCEYPGVQNVEIYDNSFTLGGGTFLRAICAVGGSTSNRNGAEYRNEDTYRVTEYGGTPFKLNGYILKTNQIYNVSIKNNKINIKSAIAYKTGFASFTSVIGVGYENNTIENNSGAEFSLDWNGINGIAFTTSTMAGVAMYTRTVTMAAGATATFTVVTENGNVVVPAPSKAVTLTLKSDGNGSVDLTTDAYGNLTASLTPAAGYKFAGWTDKNGAAADFSVQPASNATYTATFVKD